MSRSQTEDGLLYLESTWDEKNGFRYRFLKMLFFILFIFLSKRNVMSQLV